MAPEHRDRPAETAPAPLAELLEANVGDGLTLDGRTYPIVMVGRSHGPEGWETREYTLGEDEDLYLVLEGRLASGDPRRCRAVLTHELNASEVRCPTGTGRSPAATFVLRQSDEAPAEVVYQGRRYRLLRRVEARYSAPHRQGSRITWDYELGGRNLAVERWPGGELAVYEGRVVPLNRIRVRPGYGASRPSSQGVSAESVLVIGILLMLIGGALMIF